MTGDKNHRWLLFAYAAAIFTSAFLLFQVQPLITKRILPWFGGGPAVWTTCLLFFQTLLFAGYAYAHFSNWRLSPRNQAIVHIALLLAACLSVLRLSKGGLAFGIVPNDNWQPQGDENPLTRILLILTIYVGLQYFVLSATGPLLQAWFARAFPGRSPYRLYALSNLGSLLALVSYPFLVEPLLSLPTQAIGWSIGFITFATLCTATAWQQLKGGWGNAPEASTGASTQPPTTSPLASSRPRRTQYVLWLLLPAFASVVLMATTNHVSTDIAVMPFLWVAPLALYLLTFIIAFDRPDWYRPAIFATFTLATIWLTGLVHKNNVGPIKPSEFGVIGKLYFDFTARGLSPFPESAEEKGTVPFAPPVESAEKKGTVPVTPPRGLAPFAESAEQKVPVPLKPPQVEQSVFRISSLQFLAVNFAAMFGICMLCHGELVHQRPDPKYLTSFYLMIAAGGAIGGAFVTLLAPRLFKTYLEWELSLFIACVFAIGILLRKLVTSTFRDDSYPPLPLGEGRGEGLRESAGLLGTRRGEVRGRQSTLSKLAPLIVAPLILLPSAIALLDLTQFLQYPSDGIVFRQRNFFGTLAVRERNPKDPINHNFLMRHGVIAHGAQFTHSSRRNTPVTYFSGVSGIGRTMQFYQQHRPPGGLRIGVVGLGVGTLAAYASAGDAIMFYEINPAVVEIADRGPWFTYLKDCRARGASCDIKLGDGRLTLERQSANNFHILALDAFSGDSVPVHLLTEEAFEIYLSHLSGEVAAATGLPGAIVVNISNRYVNLEPVLQAIAERFDLQWLRIHNRSNSAEAIYSADFIILTRNQALIDFLTTFARTPTKKSKPPILWTDTHSSLFDVLK
jgi:hypothetical protein